MSEISAKEAGCTVRIYPKKIESDQTGGVHVVMAKDLITAELIDRLFNLPEHPAATLDYVFENGDILSLYRGGGTYYGVGEVNHLTLTYGERSEDEIDGKPGYYTTASQYFSYSFEKEAIHAFIGRLNSEHPARYFETQYAEKLDIIKIRQDKSLLCYESHYDYLEAMLEPFWKQIFAKTPDQMYCAGIVSAHGDKAYSYKSQWEEAGIPFKHGVLIFLLSYTQLLGEHPRHEVDQWVIDQYARFFPDIVHTEHLVLVEKFDLKILPGAVFYKRDPVETAIGYEEYTVWENGHLYDAYSGKDRTDCAKQYLEAKRKQKQEQQLLRSEEA